MAVKPWRIITTPVDGRNVKLLVWEDLDAEDTGQPYVVAEYNDKTIQLEGSTFGSGITIQGSIDPSELTSTDGSTVGAGWDTLNDPQGNPLSGITAEKLENVLEHCYLLRPSCSLGVDNAKVYLLLASVK